MADPFAEKTFILTAVSRRGNAHRVSLRESEARDVMRTFTNRDSSAEADNMVIEHNEGVLVLDISQIEAMSCHTGGSKEARSELIDYILGA